MTGQEAAQRTYPAHLCFSLKMLHISFIYHLFARINHIDGAQEEWGHEDIPYAASGHVSICKKKKIKIGEYIRHEKNIIKSKTFLSNSVPNHCLHCFPPKVFMF